jgi:putative hydrolase of HD superfamily
MDGRGHTGPDDDGGLTGAARFAYEMGLLKRLPRAGWLVAGVRDPESVAEHSFRTALLGYVLALLEGADPERTAVLCLFHDTQETRIGDVPYVGHGYVSTAPGATVTADQVDGLPGAVADAVGAVVAEQVAGETAEARLARDADKLECLVQAREYEARGCHDVRAWIDSSLAALRTPSALRLARACLEVPPAAWWQAVTGYRPDGA